MTNKICCICGEEFTEWGNNPWPVKTEGECCDMCNMTIVVRARIRRHENFVRVDAMNNVLVDLVPLHKDLTSDEITEILNDREAMWSFGAHFAYVIAGLSPDRVHKVINGASVKERIDMLKDMHTVVLHHDGDEEMYYDWITCAVPDQPSEDDYEFIANSDEEMNYVGEYFVKLIKRYKEDF